MIVPSLVTTFASNLINNLPAGLLARTTLEHGHASAPTIYGALPGPNITLVGSRATLLVLALVAGNRIRVETGSLGV